MIFCEKREGVFLPWQVWNAWQDIEEVATLLLFLLQYTVMESSFLAPISPMTVGRAGSTWSSSETSVAGWIPDKEE